MKPGVKVPESKPTDMLAGNVIFCIGRNVECLIEAGALNWRDKRQLREIVQELQAVIGDKPGAN